MASAFTNGAGSVDPHTLIDAFGHYLDSINDDTDLVITDALVPFIPSLCSSRPWSTDWTRWFPK